MRKGKGYGKITIKHLLTHTAGLLWTNKQANLPNESSSIPLFIKDIQNTKFNLG
ncbi:MAG: serine hydrolase [Saprospiraceae bacterium]|nr:serine hydrolase [Saprospiraceae bacterium]